MASSGLSALVDACDNPGAVAERLRAAGRPIVRVLGHDAPYTLLRAAGLTPVRMVPHPGATPDADILAGDGALTQRGRSLLQQIVADRSGDPILFTHANGDLPQLFATIRELQRTADITPRAIHMFDLSHLPRPSSRTYNEARVAQLRAWLQTIGGTSVDDASLAVAAADDHATAKAMANLRGVVRIAAIGAAYAMPHEEWMAALTDAKRVVPDEHNPVFVLGSPLYSTARERDLAAHGLASAGDDQDWGDPLVVALTSSPSRISDLADPARLSTRMLLPADARLSAIVARMKALAVNSAVIVESAGDEATAWDAGYFELELVARGYAVERIRPAPAKIAAAAEDKPRERRPGGQRSRKSLSSIASFGTFQREWFQQVRAEVAAGAPLALVNANSPQEVLRAMGVPFVVNQWWASIAAAKQQSARYFQLLEARGYPSDAEAYSAQGIAAAFDEDAEQAPWGGLPNPAFVHAVLGTDATPRIFDHWARETGADLFMFERSIESRTEFTIEWWDALQERWDEVIEPERLDMMTAELRALIDRIEATTDRRFDAARFRKILDLVNEQEDYYRLTRDLIAGAHPAPVSVADTLPATMVPQWHRGTAWARDAAKAFYEEVKARHDAGEAACAGERLRLMWVGRGMWSDMGFYQRWEESHGAVFVWSMYLALAADGYIRRQSPGQDPLRSLAARFVTMGDELRMPTWAGAWHVREAESHAVDGAIALSDADPFVLRALRRVGVPVLSLDLDNYNQESSDAASVDRQIVDFLEGEVTAYRARR